MTLREEDLIELSRLLNQGLTYEQIGEKLYLTTNGVQKRVIILKDRLGVDTREAILQRAKKLGWL